MRPILISGCTLGLGRTGSVLVAGGKVERLSDGGELDAPPGALRIDAAGGSLFAGFADTHCHPFEYGWLKRNVDLRGTANITGLRLRLQARTLRAMAGQWVTGMGWDQEAFGGRMPDRSDIDDITGEVPVALTRVCGHIALLNSAALRALGFEGREGPEFVRDASGRLTGIVKEGALEEANARIPHSAEACAGYLLSAESEAAKCGLTMLHAVVSPSSYPEELQALASLHASGSLSLRYRVYVPPGALLHVKEKGLRAKLRGAVSLAGVKVYADGSLGARTAALREPYSDDRGNPGILRHTDEELAAIVGAADAEGLQVMVHAIGDRAVEQAVGALSPYTGGGNPRRHRIEHASLLPKDLLSKMARHGIRAAVQPLFITSDSWAPQRLGERAEDLYPLRSMLAAGVVASGSSDSPIESMSPELAMWAAMVRGGIAPREALTLEEALNLYTSNAASNGFGEGGHGLREGADASFTLLDSAVGGMHPAMLRKVGTAATIVGGEIAYSSMGDEG
jgi:hypothetical protein